MNRLWTLMATCIILLVTESSAFAMTFMEPVKVMHTRYDVTTQRVRGTAFLKTADLDGTELVFSVHDEGEFEQNYVSMESADGETVYLTFPVGMWFQVKEFRTEFPERKLWLVQIGVGVNVGTCETMCLIGRHGDTYVKYVTLEDVQEEGLYGYGAWWTVEDGELVVRDWERSMGSVEWDTEEFNAQVNEARIFWDEEAKWFGVRHDKFGRCEPGRWFYTDDDGANYYLRDYRIRPQPFLRGQVIREDANGETVPMLYCISTYQVNCPYTIYSGTSFDNPGDAVERGTLYDGNEANQSVRAFFERYLYREAHLKVAPKHLSKTWIPEPKTYEDELDNIYVIAATKCGGGSIHDVYIGVKEVIAYGATPKERLNKIGYKIEDISGDGIPELIIGKIDNDNPDRGTRIVLMFTYVDGETKVVLRGWGRSRYYLRDDGFLYREGSSGARYSFSTIEEISEDGTTVKNREVFATYVRENGKTRFGNFHLIYDANGDYIVKEKDEDDESEWHTRSEKLSRTVNLNLIPMADYK